MRAGHGLKAHAENNPAAVQFILTCSQMPTAQPAKLPYCGADAATEELLPEPSQDAMRLAELEQENRRLRDDLRHLQSALASAVGLLMPYHRRFNN